MSKECNLCYCVHVCITGVEIGFNQSELVITEGNSTIVLCVGVTSGTLEREVTVYLETVSSVDALSGNGEISNTCTFTE